MNKFLSCDWGTSSFRLRLVDAGTKEISGEVLSDEGMAETHQQWLASAKPASERMDFYKAKLNAAIHKMPVTIYEHLPVILSGMASSSIGMAELAYQKFPFTWDLSQWAVKKMERDKKFSHPLYLVSGFKTEDDVMRGEETLLLGCDVPDDGEKVFVFPGTHSKHVFVKNKTGVDFKTYMTGELFSLMAEKSILRTAVQKGMDEKAFAEGVQAVMDGNILHKFFGVRTRQLLQGTTPVSNYQWLSGLLIGTELKDLKGRDFPVYLVSGGQLKHSYRTGLELTALKGRIHDLNADDMLINGHCKIASHYF
jgi:2-dehydro-3-deoxygalactonokinase